MLSLNRKLPHAVLLTMALQTGTGIWWARGLDDKVTTQGKNIEKLENSVAAMTAAKVVVLESEVARLQAELAAARAAGGRERP